MKSRFVFDTNTLISAVLSPFSINAQALKKSFEIGTPVCSEQIFEELAVVIFRKKFDKYFSKSERIKILELLRSKFIFLEVSSTLKICRDPKDDMFLNLALDSKSACIVTGDADLLVLNPFQGIPILGPGDFLRNFGK